MSKTNETYVPLEQIDKEGTLVTEVGFKPNNSVYIVGIIGVLFILSLKSLLVVLGGFLVMMALLVKLQVKDYKTMGIYEDFIIFYSEDQQTARRFDNEDIIQWTIKQGQGGADALMLVLNDEEEVYKNTFQTSKVYKALSNIMKSKEEKEIKLKKEEDKKYTISNPFNRKKD